MFKKHLTIAFLSLLFLGQLTAQNKASTVLYDKLEAAKALVYAEDYDNANIAFLKILRPTQIIPDDVCFFFGKSLYYTGYLGQAESFLRKHLALRPDNNPYKQEIDSLLNMINPNRLVNKSEKEHPNFKTLKTASPEGNTPCGGQDHVVCPICNGTKVLVKKSEFGQVYQTCGYCDNQGLMDCSTYKVYLNGDLVED